MKTKEKDIKYCGVKESKVISAHPELDEIMLKEFINMVKTRYRIHVFKDVLKKPKPWTKNPIMQQYKFTNVRREHDKQTRYLIDNIVNNPNLTLEDKIVNCFMFRAWNNWDTYSSLGLPADAQRLYDPAFKESIRPIYKRLSEDAPGRLWWSSAYNQGGTKHAWKFPDGDGYKAKKESEAKKYPEWEADIPLRVFHVGVWLGKQNIVEKLLNSKDQQECFEVIRSVRGFADFLAYQVFVDLTYIPEFPFSENEFTIAGPGCRKGLDILFKDKDKMTYEECLFWLRDNWDELIEVSAIPWNPDKIFCDLPEYDRSMNVMSLENCFCEFSKYIRALKGTGRPRVKYKGV